MGTEQVYTDTRQRSVLGIIPDLIANRELLFNLVAKGLRVRYRIAAAGLFWAVLQPLLMMAILSLVFGLLLGARAEAFGIKLPVPYPAFLLVGLIPWQFFASAVNEGTRSLITHRELVNKVYFPRELIPLSTVLDWFVNLLIGTALLVVALALFGCSLGLHLLWLVPLLALELALVIGLTLILSCLNVFFRDVQYIVEAAILFGFYACPILYPLASVRDFAAAHEAPEALRLYLMNPMAGLIEACHQAIVWEQAPGLDLLWWPLAFTGACLVFGAWFYRRNACCFADYL